MGIAYAHVSGSKIIKPYDCYVACHVGVSTRRCSEKVHKATSSSSDGIKDDEWLHGATPHSDSIKGSIFVEAIFLTKTFIALYINK